MLGNLGSHLRRIAIYGLPPRNHQVVLQRADGTGKRIGGRQGVSTCKFPVAQVYSIIRAHGKRLPQDVISLGRPHGDHRYMRTVLILKA